MAVGSSGAATEVRTPRENKSAAGIFQQGRTSVKSDLVEFDEFDHACGKPRIDVGYYWNARKSETVVQQLVHVGTDGECRLQCWQGGRFPGSRRPYMGVADASA